MEADEKNSFYDLRTREIYAAGICAAAVLFLYWLGFYKTTIAVLAIFVFYRIYLVFIRVRDLSQGSLLKEVLFIAVPTMVVIFWRLVLKYSGN